MKTNTSTRVLLGLCLLGFVTAQARSSGQADPAKLPAKPITFDVVTVKPNKGGNGSMSWRFGEDGFKMVNLGLVQMIQTAFNLDNATEEQVAGLPSWAKDAHYDLQVKVGEEDLAAYKLMKNPEKNAMLRAVLEDRFKLKAHRETHEMPIYALVVAKGGSKLKAADPADTYEKGLKFGDKKAGPGGMSSNIDGDTFRMQFQACALDGLIANLTSQARRKVIDKTGLTGKYDFTLAFTPEWV